MSEKRGMYPYSASAGECSGLVFVTIHNAEDHTYTSADLSPDEARLLGLRLIRLADRAEEE